MYENIEDALRDAVRALGGTKAVGGKLFPSLPIEQAASRVADCLNVDRRQHFAPSEVCWLLRQARIAGHHETMVYIATVAGYEPPRPASDLEELAALQQAFIRATSDLKAIGHRIETISARAAIRPAA
jgi:hypothetical protein